LSFFYKIIFFENITIADIAYKFTKNNIWKLLEKQNKKFVEKVGENMWLADHRSPIVFFLE